MLAMTFASCMKEGREKGREGEGKLSFYISMTTEVMGSTSRWGKKRLKKNPALLICSYVKIVIKMCLKFKRLQVEKKAGDCSLTLGSNNETPHAGSSNEKQEKRETQKFLGLERNGN